MLARFGSPRTPQKKEEQFKISREPLKLTILGSGGGREEPHFLSTTDFVDIDRGQKRHINIWYINNFSVTPVTDPPGREPDSSRPGARTKTLMFLGFRTQHINF